MPRIPRTMLAVLFSLVSISAAIGQTRTTPDTPQTSILIVTATASTQQVRFASLGEVHQTRLQVFSIDGTQVYNSGFHLGNLIDWQLKDQQGQALAPGSYLYLITVKDFSERLTQKYGTAILEPEQVYLEQPGRNELPSLQAAALEANRQAERLTVVDRIGISAFNSSSTLASTPTSSTGTEPSATDNVSTPPTIEENATGSGSQDYLARWTDNIGTLGNSALFQNGSRIGLGTTTPGAVFHVVGTQGSVGAGTFQLDTPTSFGGWAGAYPAFEIVNTNQTNNNVSLFSFSDVPSGASHAGIGAVNLNHINKYGDLFFYTKQADGYQVRMGIYGSNVGIATTTPKHRLSVIGGPAWTSSGWAGAVELADTSAIGWRSNIGGQRFGIGQSGGGLYFFRTASDPGTSASPAVYDMLLSDTGNLGIGIGANAPSSRLDVSGALTVRGIAAPAVAPAGRGRIFFDSALNKFRVSQNGGAYVDLIGGGGAGLTLPFSQTQASASTLFSLTNTGTGGAGSFAINNSGSSANALSVTSNASNGAPALKVITTGSGGAGAADFRNENAGSGNPVLFLRNEGTGSGLEVQHAGASGQGISVVLNGSNASTALKVSTNGPGKGAEISSNLGSTTLTVGGGTRALFLSAGGFVMNHQNQPSGTVLTAQALVVRVFDNGVAGAATVTLPDAGTTDPGTIIYIHTSDPSGVDVFSGAVNIASVPVNRIRYFIRVSDPAEWKASF